MGQKEVAVPQSAFAYSMEDVQSILRGASRLNEMQDQIRQFFGLIAPYFQNAYKSPYFPEAGVVIPAVKTPYSMDMEIRLSMVQRVRYFQVTVLSNFEGIAATQCKSHVLWDLNGFHPPSRGIIHSIWATLPAILDTVDGYLEYEIITLLQVMEYIVKQ